MSNLFQQLLTLTPGSSDYINCLKNFNTIHAASLTFVDKFSLEDKKSVVCLLLKRIREDVSYEELVSSITALRLLGREKDGMEDFLKSSTLEFISELALKDNNIKENLELKTEAAKCIVNMIFKSEELNSLMIKSQHHFRLLEYIQTEGIPNDLLFAYLRILFFMCRPVDSNKEHRVLADKGAIQLCYKLLEKYLEDFPNPTNYQVIKEILLVLFNLTVDMGSLNRTTDVMDYQHYLPNYAEMIGALLKIYTYPLDNPSTDPAIYDLKNSVLNCFVNIPLKYFSILVHVGDKDKNLKAIFDMLEWEIRNTDEKKSLVTLLMVVQSLLSQTPEARPYAMKRMFPGRDLEEERNKSEESGQPINMDAVDKDADTVGNRIVKMMTAISMPLKYAANELLFSLVGEDADDFVRLTGFGNAAGLLAMRNLFGMGNNLNRDTASELRSAGREEKENIQSQVKPPKAFPELIPAKEGETEEEKDERTRINVEKMVDAGLIQLIKKDEKK